MPLTPGDKLGPYEILAPLGAGGMGEVYKARDPRLERFVAIKVLPDHIAKREDLRARFEREARAVASLNHPHICVLHDIGPNYMVLELIEGETLEARITKGALPLDTALTYATQIADALDRAHRAGVTHRDIKPGNIMLTRDGVKILDFGLAKSTAKPGPTDATIVASLTTEGTVLGTPQYMAPEQFEGKEADARADIWAFGAVLYEMTTGQKAFQGKSYSSLVGAILSVDPAPMSVKPFTPSWLERMVRRCLQKEPEDRYHCMHDIVLDLKSPPVEAAATPSKPSRIPWAVASVLLILVILFAGLWWRKPSQLASPSTLEIYPPEGTTFASIETFGGSAISPDGRTLAFVAANEKGVSQLYVRALDSLQSHLLPGTEVAGRPFWSPDSRSLGFFGDGKLKRVDLVGGAPISLCDTLNGRGGDWNPEGLILFATNSIEGIQSIPAGGGAPTPVTRLDKEAGENRHYYPQFLPGGRKFLYLVLHNDPGKSGIAMGSLDGKPVSSPIFLQTGYSARYDAATQRLLYVQGQGTLMSRRFEGNPPRLVKDPIVVAESISTNPVNGYTDFSLASSGTLFYGRGGLTGHGRFRWRDRTGKLLESIGEPFQFMFPFRVSPDESRVAYSAGAGMQEMEVWVMSLANGASTRITFRGGASPIWSPDGKFVYYNGPTGIGRKAADGSGEENILTKGSVNDQPQSVSPDGKVLLFGAADILKLPLSGGGKVEPYLKTNSVERDAEFSPDGRWVAYTSNESGRAEIYIQGYPELRGKWLVSTSGGRYPAWRQDGRELYWVALDGTTLVAANIELLSDTIRSARPQSLFSLPPAANFRFQPSRDGQRFLMHEPDADAKLHRSMVVMQNWAARREK